jgi:FMN reductase (NADPH)/FMN reductase [NAD(P)H]
MNSTIQTILQRKSVRVYEHRSITDEIKTEILRAAMRAPTSGNMMLYSIIEVNDRAKKNMLAKTCDNQPFIARAPLVLLFLADYQRWHDYFIACGVEQMIQNVAMRTPAEGDLMLACCDALIAAQTAVIAAESLGIGSCYIGDIMENCETHREMFNLPRYTFPVCLLCFGYPSQGQIKRKQTPRFDERYIISQDTYHQLNSEELMEMFFKPELVYNTKITRENLEDIGRQYYKRKFNSDFAIEMNRSVRAWLQSWSGSK